LLALNVNGEKVYNPSTDRSRIKEIEGYVVKDQSKTKSGSYYLIIDAYSGYLNDKTRVSIKGQIPIMFKKDYDLLFYTPIRARVEYCEDIDIYKAKEIIVLENNNKLSKFYNKLVFRVRDNRVYLLKKVRAYIHCPLARMLLLGRCDQEGFMFKEYALNLGCAHLLALSGMHLSVITLFFSFIFTLFVSKGKAKYLSVVFIFYFIYITGPIPSLIRSLIMYLLNFTKIKSAIRSEVILLLTAIIQAIVFPSTFRSAGCLFSYGALCAIFFYASIFKDVNKIISPVLTTVFAILITYPLSISMGGHWCILSIILAPTVTIFVTFEMIVSLCLLLNSIVVDFNYWILAKIDEGILEAIIRLFINLEKEVNHYFHRIIRFVERLITFIFEKGTSLNDRLPQYLISSKGYLIFALLVLTSLVVYLYATHSFKFRSYKKNELEFPL
jgi:ComEC/Rec2-related protein